MQKTDAELIAEVEGLVNAALSDARVALEAKETVEILSEADAMAEICDGFKYAYAAELYRELARRLKAANERWSELRGYLMLQEPGNHPHDSKDPGFYFALDKLREIERRPR